MSDYNFSKYIRHTSSFEAPDGNKLLTAAGWVEASKKIIVAMTEVCSLANQFVNDWDESNTGLDICWSTKAEEFKKALHKLAELDGGK